MVGMNSRLINGKVMESDIHTLTSDSQEVMLGLNTANTDTKELEFIGGVAISVIS